MPMQTVQSSPSRFCSGCGSFHTVSQPVPPSPREEALSIRIEDWMMENGYRTDAAVAAAVGETLAGILRDVRKAATS
jgi:hypothetical protein